MVLTDKFNYLTSLNMCIMVRNVMRFNVYLQYFLVGILRVEIVYLTNTDTYILNTVC